MDRIVNSHRLMIKLFLGLLIKLVLLLIWGLSFWCFYRLLYDRYVLEAYPLRDYLPVLILCFGNIWFLPWLILWYEKLYPAFDKPKIYYRVKDWFISLKENSFFGMFIFNSIDFFIKLCMLTYATIVILACVILGPVLLVISSMIFHHF